MNRRTIEKWVLAIILIFLLHVAIFCIKGGNDMTTITVRPTPDKVKVGDPFVYAVEITPDGVIAGGQLNLSYNAQAMRVDSVVQGSFLGTQSFWHSGTIDNSLGLVKDTYGVVTTPGQGISTKGVFVMFNCTALAAGKSPAVTLTNVILGNLEGISVPFELAVTQAVFLLVYDLDGDGDVDRGDLMIAAGQWGTPGSADFNQDGKVDILDIVIMGQNFTEA